MSHDRRTLPATAVDLLERLALALRVDRLRVFGGAALDLLADPYTPCHDIDIALPNTFLSAFDPSPEIDIRSGRRPYWIRHHVPVTMVTGQWRGTGLDINFLDEMDKIGHFDIERVWWVYPDRTFTDPHNLAFEPVRTFRLVTTPKDDNPLLLLNRVIKLAAKYEVQFWRQQHLRALVERLATAVARRTPTTDFHGPEAHDAHLRAIARSVHRAKQSAVFLAGCLEAGVLDVCLRPLADLLRRRPSTLTPLAHTSTDDMFWAMADDIVANDGARWRHYQRERPCGSA